MSPREAGDDMTTFLHTADWHLGMTRRFLSPEAQARYADARIQAVRDIARIADEEECAFVVACGDLFDSNHVDRQVVARALDVMSAFTVPLLLLPGNHDPLGAGSVYGSRMFEERKPDLVTVIDGTEPIAVAPGVEVVGAPWATRRPGADIAAAAVSGLGPAPGVTRVLAAHGAVDVLSPDADDPALVRMAPLVSALDAGAVSYVALGDRHSATEVGGDPRIRYPGTPVATGHAESDAGKALLVHLGDSGPRVEELPVGEWTFSRREVRLDSADDVERLDADLAAITDKRRTVVRLVLVGALGVGEDARLQRVLARHEDLFASLTVSERSSHLVVVANEGDLDALGLAGYAYDAAAEIAALASAEGPRRQAAEDALRLLHRLSGASS